METNEPARGETAAQTSTPNPDVAPHMIIARAAGQILGLPDVAELQAENARLKEALLSAECTLGNLLNDAKAGRPYGPYAVEGLTMALSQAQAALASAGGGK